MVLGIENEVVSTYILMKGELVEPIKMLEKDKKVEHIIYNIHKTVVKRKEIKTRKNVWVFGS